MRFCTVYRAREDEDYDMVAIVAIEDDPEGRRAVVDAIMALLADGGDEVISIFSEERDMPDVYCPHAKCPSD